jgi:hypothetical protein
MNATVHGGWGDGKNEGWTRGKGIEHTNEQDETSWMDARKGINLSIIPPRMYMSGGATSREFS